MAAEIANTSDDSPGSFSIAPGVRVARRDLTFSFSRSSGPGGQAVNKLSTRAQLRVRISAIHGLDDAARDRLRKLAGRRLVDDDFILFHADLHRSQLDNKQACLVRLRDLVIAAMRTPKVRKKRKPTRAMIERRLESKRRRSEKKLHRGSGRAGRDLD